MTDQTPLGNGKGSLDIKRSALHRRVIVIDGASAFSSLHQHLGGPFHLSRPLLGVHCGSAWPAWQAPLDQVLLRLQETCLSFAAMGYFFLYTTYSTFPLSSFSMLLVLDSPLCSLRICQASLHDYKQNGRHNHRFH